MNFGDFFYFRYLEIDIRAWDGLQQTVTYATANHHVGAVSSLLLFIHFFNFNLSSRFAL